MQKLACRNVNHAHGKNRAHLRRVPPITTNTSTRGERYRKRLDSTYALQMRAMERLQKRRAQSGHKRSPERPASGGCEGVFPGQFKSRYSGLDRFVLARTGEGGRDGGGAGQAGASRFGGGVPFYG